MRNLRLPVLALALFIPALAFAENPAAPSQIHTNRTSDVKLPLPKGEDMFHFLIFGDRTGGPPEGLEVLKQAVTDTNLLDPDLVMTVGDLLPGYCGPEDWLKDMTDYRNIMTGLKMPWFPVAGNHDVYWRGPNRPPHEHEAAFEKHFGPLWYWFEHKKCGFVVLYTDEGNPEQGPKEFTRPAQQKMSEEQLTWLQQSLAEMKGLEHVFVFLHHPRWIEKSYPGAEWDRVHGMLASAGNVRAVFAGHIHRLRYDGKRDGIEYITLGTTGGSMPGFYPQAGYMHHMNAVTVRPDGFVVSALPVGQVMDPRHFTPELIAEIDAMRNADFAIQPSPITIDENGLGAGLLEFRLSNPGKYPVEITVVPDEEPREWLASADHLHMVLEPGKTFDGSFSVIRVRQGFDEGVSIPAVEFRQEILIPDARVPLPPRRVTLPVTLKAVSDTFFQNQPDQALELDGKSAVRVELGRTGLHDGPFTVEAWVKTAEEKISGDIISKAEQSEYALNLASSVPGFHVFLNGKYESAIATAAVPPNQWTHLAGVFDGSRLTLYVNGQPVATREASGKRGTNPLPLYLGANPDTRSNPTQFLTGALDEARLSRSARYTAAFTPARRYTRDADTVLLYHCDRILGPFLPSDAADSPYGTVTGNVTTAPVQ